MRAFVLLRISVLKVLLLVGLLSACQKKPEAGSFWVAVPWVVGNSSEERFIEIQGMESLQELRSPQIEIFKAPRLTSSGALTGDRPQLRLMKDARGYWVGMDVESTVLLSLYAFVYQLREQLTSMGRQHLLTNPLQIGWVEGRDSNAAYLGSSLFAFFSNGSARAPLPLNPGVVAHEFFHFIFEQILVAEGNSPELGFGMRLSDGPLFLGPGDWVGWGNWPPLTAASNTKSDFPTGLNAREEERFSPALGTKPSGSAKDPESRDFNRLLYFIYHEALADVWAWVFTGNAETVGLSIPEVSSHRSLLAPLQQSFTEESVRLAILNSMAQGRESTGALRYFMGTTFARSIFQASAQRIQKRNLPPSDQRQELAEALLRACSHFARSYLEASRKKEILKPLVFLNHLQEHLPELGVRLNDTQKSQDTPNERGDLENKNPGGSL